MEAKKPPVITERQIRRVLRNLARQYKDIEDQVKSYIQLDKDMTKKENIQCYNWLITNFSDQFTDEKEKERFLKKCLLQ